MTALLWGLLLCRAAAAPPPGDDGAARRARWDARTSPAVIEATAQEFLGMLVLDDFQQRVTNLRQRPEMTQVARLAQEKHYAEALALFERYYLNKLRYPTQYGLSVHDVNAYASGVCGHGAYPSAFLQPNPDREKVLAEADGLMRGALLVNGKPVEIGPPGAVNWNLPFGPDETVPRDQEVLRPLAAPMRGFSALVQAYLLTHNEAYLQHWAAYLDDWSLNARYVDRIHPCFAPTSFNPAAAEGAIGLVRQLGALAAALPSDRDPLPPAVFARVVRKLLGELLLHVVYIRSNTHNWTPSAGTMLTALLYDEFKVAPIFFREARRRQIEDNAVTQNLRDGTENQQCPWYNENYLSVEEAFRLLDARETLPPWKELPWVLELRGDLGWRREVQEHLNDRVNTFIHLRTPQNEWPIPIRGGDKRQAAGVPAGRMADIAPDAYRDPTNQGIVAAVTGTASEMRPGYTDEWFPYAGYNIVREGWEKESGYGFLFCSPRPGAYGGYRSRSNNNTFGLAAFGQDLLVDDNTEGHYMYPGSPITVDRKPQFFHAGVYKVPSPSAHKVYLVSAWTDPAPWRWHSSPRFSLMEGVYSGAYADPDHRQPLGRFSAEEARGLSIPLDQTLQGVTHQRLVHYLRRHGLWLVTDRMLSTQAHAYEQAWCFPMLPGPYPAFLPGQVKVDAAARRIFTDAGENEINRKSTPMANVSLTQFTQARLSYSSQERAKPPIADGRILMYGWKKVKAAWQGEGEQQIVTAILPRKPGSGPESDLRAARQLTGPGGVTGCELTLPDGGVVRYLAAPNGDGELALGDLHARGEALLLDGDGGMMLGCKSLALKGRPLPVPATDFEFTLGGGGLAGVVPIYRPIAPVRILPERDVFIDRQEVTLACLTPGVELHYTLDGTDPTPRSPLYAGPFALTGSATVKARAYRPGVTANPVQLSGTEATVASLAVFAKAAPIAAVAAPRAQPGLSYQYFEEDWKRLWLFLDEVKPIATGTSPALLDPAVIPAENPPLGEAAAPRSRCYALQYTGYLKVPADGVYALHAPREYVMPDTDAGYELQVTLGNHEIPWGYRTQVVGLNEWYPSTRLHALGSWSVALKQGLHPFKVIYLDYRTDAPQSLNIPGLRDYIWSGVMPDLRLSGPGIDRRPIPAEWLWH